MKPLCPAAHNNDVPGVEKFAAIRGRFYRRSIREA